LAAALANNAVFVYTKKGKLLEYYALVEYYAKANI
jgi:hypothetical protein